MKKLTFLAATLLFVSCSDQNEQFCECMDAGEKLNNFSVTLFDKNITEKQANELKALKAEKDKACADFKQMKGDEMLELQKNCTRK